MMPGIHDKNSSRITKPEVKVGERSDKARFFPCGKSYAEVFASQCDSMEECISSDFAD